MSCDKFIDVETLKVGDRILMEKPGNGLSDTNIYEICGDFIKVDSYQGWVPKCSVRVKAVLPPREKEGPRPVPQSSEFGECPLFKCVCSKKCAWFYTKSNTCAILDLAASLDDD